ncbi:MAG: hypothetical protein ACP5KX_07855 [Caldisericia bacterium]
MKKRMFLFLKVREKEKQNPSKKKEKKSLTPLEDGFLKNLIKKEVYAYA